MAVLWLRRGIDNEGAYEHLRVQGERVDDVVREDVALMKMDVEGFEPHVLEVMHLEESEHDLANNMLYHALALATRQRSTTLCIPKVCRP